MTQKKVATPRMKFAFDNEAQCTEALQTIQKDFNPLMASIAKNGGEYLLFVQSRLSTIFDLKVRSAVETLGGKFICKVF